MCRPRLTTFALYNHRITGWKGHLEIIESNQVKQIPYSMLHRKLFRWVLSISREGDSTISLDSLFQCSVTLTIKNVFLMFIQNCVPVCGHLCSCLFPMLLALVYKHMREEKGTEDPCFHRGMQEYH